MILQADAFTGPYEIVRENYRPLGSEVGDFDIVQDEKTQKAYLFMDADHRRVVGLEMSEDYLSAERKFPVSMKIWSVLCAGRALPFLSGTEENTC